MEERGWVMKEVRKRKIERIYYYNNIMLTFRCRTIYLNDVINFFLSIIDDVKITLPLELSVSFFLSLLFYKPSLQYNHPLYWYHKAISVKLLSHHHTCFGRSLHGKSRITIHFNQLRKSTKKQFIAIILAGKVWYDSNEFHSNRKSTSIISRSKVLIIWHMKLHFLFPYLLHILLEQKNDTCPSRHWSGVISGDHKWTTGCWFPAVLLIIIILGIYSDLQEKK